MALINSTGHLGGLVGPVIIGWIKGGTQNLDTRP
jgi:hypothetical protein